MVFNKKGQISVFMIIALVLIIFTGLLFYLQSIKTDEVIVDTITIAELQSKQDSLNLFIRSCLELTVWEGIHEYGILEDLSEDLVSLYVKNSLDSCLDNFESFKEQGFAITKGDKSVHMEIFDDLIEVELNYPLEFTIGDSTIYFEKDIYHLPRTVMKEINLDGYTNIVAPNLEAQIIIPPGTHAYLDGNPINEVGIKLMDREFNGNNNAPLMGMLAFYGTPHGATFSKDITVIIHYKDTDVPDTFEEADLQLSYFSDSADGWVSMPSVVDTIQNTVTAQTRHFSSQGVVIRCTEEEDLTYVYLPMIVKEDCETCEGWTIDDSLEDVGELWIQSDAITNGLGLGEGDTCDGPTVITSKVSDCSNCDGDCTGKVSGVCPDNGGGPECSCDESYYSYETIDFVRTTPVHLKFAKEGDSCSWADDGTYPSIEIIDTNHPKSADSPVGDIVIEAICNEDDVCLILNHDFADNSLDFTLQVTNGGTPDACTRGGIVVQLNGFGILAKGSYYACESAGDEQEMPIIGGEPQDLILSVCECQKVNDEDLCMWIPKDGADVIKGTPNSAKDRRDVNVYDTGHGSCPENFAEVYQGVGFVVNRVLDTRSRSMEDKFGDFPDFQYKDNLQVPQDTEMVIFGSALVGDTCWLLVEAQFYVAARKEKPDFFVKLDQVNWYITGEGAPPPENLPPLLSEDYLSNTNPAPLYEGSGVQGIDVSHWNGFIDWPAAKADGKHFAFIKASEGTNSEYDDDRFKFNIESAKKAGVLAGAYHFARPTRNSGADEAKHFASRTSKYLKSGYMRPALDLEDGYSMTSRQLSAWVRDFMGTYYDETGVMPVLYTSASAISSELDHSIDQYDLWVAHWGVPNPTVDPSRGWYFWQYSSKGQVSWQTSTYVDLNVFNGNMQELKAKFKI